MQKSFLRRRKEQNKTRRLSGFYGFFTLVLARRCWGKPQDQSAHPCHSPYTGDNKRRIFRKPCRCSYWWECHTNGADRIGGSDQKIKDYSKYWQRGGTFKSDLVYFWNIYYHKSGRRLDPWRIDLGPTARPQSKKPRQSPKVQRLCSPAALT